METPSQLQCQVPRVEPLGQGVLDQVQRALNKVSGWVSKGFELLDGLGIGGVLDGVRQALDKMNQVMDALRRVAEKAIEAIKGVFMPWIMPSYADKWLQISNDMTNVAQTIGPTGLRAPGSPDWTGVAADEYRARAAESVEAAEFASQTAGDYSAALADAAHQGQQLYIELLLLIAALIADLLLASVEAGTIVGIPAAIIQLVATALPLEVAIAATIKQLFDFIKNQVTTFQQLKASLESASHVFPGQAWSKLVA